MLSTVVTDYQSTLARTAKWGGYFASTWNAEAPMRIHSSDVGEDGAPRWHPDFERWLTREGGRRRDAYQTEEALRTTKVMRRLRRTSIRQYEVLYRMLLLREPPEATTAWLNERARRNGVPLPEGRNVHYRTKDTLAILIAGTEWALHHW